MSLKEQKYQELGFSSDFIFSKVMRNKKLCKKLLEIILNITIERIEYIEEQKSVDHAVDAKGVRLDVYVKDAEHTIYNIEMQTTNPKNLPKRSRYYQGMIDLNILEKGADYNNLKKSFVIFICTKDIFGKGRHIYTFENLCIQDPEIQLNDESTKVFLNPISAMKDVDEELSNFLSYVETGNPVDEFTWELEKEVEEVKKNKGLEAEFMTLQNIKMECYKEGLEQGLEQGSEQATEKIAIEMIRENDSDEKIHRITKLSLSRIAELREREMCLV